MNVFATVYLSNPSRDPEISGVHVFRLSPLHAGAESDSSNY